MWTYNQTDELYHYGVPGMRWGKRKLKQEYKTAKRKAFGDLLSKEDKINAKYDAEDFIKGRVGYTKADKAALKKANAEYDKARSNAKAAYKSGVVKLKKDAVRNYENKLKEHEKAQNEADKEWENVRQLRKKTGKTKLGRVINTMKANSPEVKAYTKAWDAWEKKQNLADKKFTEYKNAYAKTGENILSRIVNNMKYGTRY